ncbi:DMT family transporter [Streptomyces radicis]|uniref:EamA family transporter n=1 Tax=Streptomyces radicis TaxID=1750517 RepID=A0A3A9WDS0_9ACTN|nr:EamA family transporter [Streptomyces radicis]RKN05806.1 EamA family transporter [Streptomyces radicis]RKN17639.1 EamA family transporter [Streptomyces radicis]
MSSSSLSSPLPSPTLSPVGGAPLVLAAATLWGTTGTAAHLAPEAASALSIGAATMGVGGLLTFATAGRSALAVLRGGAEALRCALLGALCVVVYPLAFYTSMAWAGVAVGTVVSIGSAPVVAALLERTLDGARLTGRWLGATACAGAGCLALVAGGPVDGGGDRMAAGVALGLLTGASYAAYACAGARLIRRGHSSRASMGVLFGLAATVLLPVLMATGGPLVGEPRGVAVVAYLAVVPMWLAYALFGAGLARVSASTATTLSLFEPVVAAALGVVVVGERLGGLAWAGVALIVAGLALMTARRRSRAA